MNDAQFTIPNELPPCTRPAQFLNTISDQFLRGPTHSSVQPRKYYCPSAWRTSEFRLLLERYKPLPESVEHRPTWTLSWVRRLIEAYGESEMPFDR
jgi:hypothetical protein